MAVREHDSDGAYTYAHIDSQEGVGGGGGGG